ncbi:hypothetical protein [Salinicola halophilus]|uniref:hypothetical protein n=1 Tax=Salinicola halophilus TaxID=184065 RepID=UPI000DA15CA9|nr:hypothetical protein [Salinicola halophilus]
MDMFTLKQVESQWVASCRACGHEQALQAAENGNEVATNRVVDIKCERCPSEEQSLTLSATHDMLAGHAYGTPSA